LSVKELSSIAEIVTSKFINRVNNLGINMKITKNGISWLVENGFDKAYGARPLKRVVQRSLENEFAKKLLSGEFQEGDSVVVTSKKNNLVINKTASK
jgi:ATP-dependent Clp protease ATP-binding subunit ClpA